MGISRLIQLIKEESPEAIKEVDLKRYKGKSIAIDAFMTIYQYVIGTQSIKKGESIMEMKDEEGNLTAHLLGILNRSVYFMERGILPCWVFYGCPPEEKTNTIMERVKIKEESSEKKEAALLGGDIEQALKYANRSICITENMIEDAKILITLLGLPCIQAPGESEAQCSALANAGKVSAVYSEDLDCLLFGSPRLLKSLQFSLETCTEINLEIVLEKLGITYTQFIDLCIISGCGYYSGLKGIGVFKALDLIKKFGAIENINTNNNSFDLSQMISQVNRIRNLFYFPQVINPNELDLVWVPPDFENLIEFLCIQKGFNMDRIENAFYRLKLYIELIK